MSKHNLPQNNPLDNGLTPDFISRPTGRPAYEFDSQQIFSLLAEACDCALDLWQGHSDPIREQRIDSASPSLAAKTKFRYRQLLRAFQYSASESDFERALSDALAVLNSVRLKINIPAFSDRRLLESQIILETWYFRKLTTPAASFVHQSVDQLERSNQSTIFKLLTAACRVAAEFSRKQENERLADQFSALALALTTEDSYERADLIQFFVSPSLPAEADEKLQARVECLDLAISSLVEFRAALLAERPSAAVLEVALEEVEAINLLDWLETHVTGDVETLFESIAGGEE